MVTLTLKLGRRESNLTPHPAPLPRKADLLMRRILLLATTMAIALVLVGGVALSKQRQDQNTSPRSPTTTKDESDISTQSTAVKASFASGSGANFLGVKVSDHDNLLSF